MSLHEDLMASPLLQELEAIAEGKRKLPDSHAIRHHFVPAFLLRRFSRDRNGVLRLCQLDVTSGRPVWADPGTAASRRRLYELPDEDGAKHNFLESYFMVVEQHASAAIRRLCNTGKLQREDRPTLAVFIALLEGRTLGGIERLERLSHEVFLGSFASHASDPAEWAETYREAIGEETPDEMEKQRQYMLTALKEGRVKNSDPKALALGLLLEAAAASMQTIFQLQWELLNTIEPSFVTSDRGLALHDSAPPYPWSGQAWMSSSQSQGTVPLDPHHCLLISVPAGAPYEPFRARAASSKEVQEINLRSYGYASPYLFAHSQEQAARVRRLARQRPQLVVKPRPSPQVFLVDAEPGDTRFADENAKRGWPRYLEHERQWHDYVVIEQDEKAVERSIALSEIGRERAVRRFGTENVRQHTEPVHPSCVRSGDRAHRVG